jgi:hypothetical protein
MATSSDNALQQCLKTCQQCHDLCLQSAMQRCLKLGGAHIEPHHFQLMLGCAELCQTAANFMLRGNREHGVVCAACARVCQRCAESCEQLGDMQDCVEMCRRCAAECERMAA